MKLRIPRKSLLVGASCIAVSTASGAFAQQGEEVPQATESRSQNQFDEIIVTARKRDESLMDVPVAVTAIGAAQLERTGAVGLEQIAQLAPQVIIARASSGAGASLSIRGLGTPFFDPAAENSVAVNIDGVAASRGNIISQGFFDLQQVEVLKGPQALFFGKNSPAGVISLRSVSPSDTLEGYVRVGYEFEARERYAEAAIGGPLTESLRARIAIRGSKMRGWLTNTAVPLNPNPFYGAPTPGATSKGNGGEDILGRVTLVYEPGSDFDATLKVSAGKHKDNGTTGQAVCAPESGLTQPTIFGFFSDPGGDCKFDQRYQNASITETFAKNYVLGRNGKPYADSQSMLASLTMNYNFGNLTLTSVTGYFKLKYKNLADFSFSSTATNSSTAAEDTERFSQELRLVSDFDGPLNFTLGGYYEDGKVDTLASAIFVPVYDPVADTFQSYVYESGVDSKALSVFGQLRWEIVEQLELAGGVRYSRDRKSITQGQLYVNPAFGFIRTAGDFLSGKFKDSNWSPEVTLSWKPNDDVLVYGGFKTGYKGGGIGTPALLAAGQVLSDISYGSETIKGFEGGVKAELLDRTARVQLTAYSYDYSNLQISVFDQTLFQFRLANAPSSRIKGLELAGELRPVNGLSLNAALAYNDAKYTSFPSFACYQYQTIAQGCTGGVVDPVTGFVAGGQQSLTGRSLSRAPKWAVNAGFNYDHEMGNGIGIGINADANYSSGYDAAEDKAPVARQKSYWLLNAGARVYSDDAGWDLSIVGRNLTNRYYRHIAHGKSGGSPFEYTTYLPRTREIRVQLGYKF